MRARYGVHACDLWLGLRRSGEVSDGVEGSENVSLEPVADPHVLMRAVMFFDALHQAAHAIRDRSDRR